MQQLNQIVQRLANAPEVSVESLRELVIFFRTTHQTTGSAAGAFAELRQLLDATPEFRAGLVQQLQHLLDNYGYLSFFTQYSHLDQTDFLSGVWARIKHKVIPQLPPPTDVQFLLRQIVDPARDRAWLRQLPPDGLQKLFGDQLAQLDTKHLRQELVMSIQALAVKISAFGLDHRLRSLFLRLELDNRPFAELQTALGGELTAVKMERAQTMLAAIQANITSLRLRKNEIGTTLKLTYESQRTLEKVTILKDLLTLHVNWQEESAWRQVLRNAWSSECSRMGLRRFINGHLDLVSLEIVEHTAKSGEKYIAENKSEYFGILWASMLGGLLIAFFAAGKILLYDLKAAELPEALLFSLNYATCFVLVKAMGGMIATKQPAMTASTIIKAIDENNDLKLSGLKEIVALVKKASQSQFISFVGNLSVAFPLAIAIAWGYGELTGTDFISADKGASLLNSIWPWLGGAVPFAAIAGVFLALSGLISGYFDNKVIAGNLEARFLEQPLLKRLFGLPARKRIAAYICKNLGGLSGNISLGFFLGMAGYVGFITGLPFDIRHIAFSSANFGFAFQTIPIGSTTLLLGALSILLIGAVNFTVSFGITLYLTLKSRGISFADTFRLIGKLGWELVLRPWQFILPASQQAEVTMEEAA